MLLYGATTLVIKTTTYRYEYNSYSETYRNYEKTLLRYYGLKIEGSIFWYIWHL